MTAESNPERQYPIMRTGLPDPVRPLSIICVRFSNEFEHNILKSSCVYDQLNQFIVVDNQLNLFHKTLSQAISAGIEQAINDIIVVVHEDVLLLPEWQSMFEISLNALEAVQPNWLVLGVIGWDESKRIVGRCSDPKQLYNPDWEGLFEKAERIDEQLIVLHKHRQLRPDPNLPTIHNLGRDLLRSAHTCGTPSYVLNAPSIHKYADSDGNRVRCAVDSDKIRNRVNMIYKQHKHCSDEYIDYKWPAADSTIIPVQKNASLTSGQNQLHQSPIILVTTEARLHIVAQSQFCEYKSTTSALSESHRINEPSTRKAIHKELRNNRQKNNLQVTESVLRAIFRKIECPDRWHQELIQNDLTGAATALLSGWEWPKNWVIAGIENLLVLTELIVAFPNATIIIDPDACTTANHDLNTLSSCDNELGRSVLREAYTTLGFSLKTAITDSIQERQKVVTEYLTEQLREQMNNVEETTKMQWQILEADHLRLWKIQLNGISDLRQAS